jgi:putative ABC transport system permease protein
MPDRIRRTHWIADAAHDVRFAARLLAKDRTFTLVVAMTFALGLGANAALFSVIEAVLLQPLPYRNPDRLVWITENSVTGNNNLAMLMGGHLEAWQRRATSFEAMSVLLAGDATMTGEPSVQVRVACVSDRLTRVFGVAPVLGRDFLPQEFEHAPHAPGVRASSANRSDTGIAVMSDRLFRRLGADPAILGKPVVIGNVSYTAVGVLPPGFRLPVAPTLQLGIGPQTDVDILLNTTVSSTSRGPGAVLGRLKPGVSVETAAVELEVIRAGANQAGREEESAADLTLEVTLLHDHVVRSTRRALFILWASVGFVLLIACLNIMNLLLARAVARAHETALRSALGAGRWRLARQALAEGMVLVFAAGLAGIALAYGLVHVLAKTTAIDIPRMQDTTVNWTVLLFSAAVSGMSGIAFGLIPALSSSVVLADRLKEGVRTTVTSPRTRRWHATLVVCEIALALIPLAGAGLLLRSLWHVRSEAALLAPDRALAASVQYGNQQAFPTTEERLRENNHILAQIELLPAVRAAAFWRVTFGYPARIAGLPQSRDETIAMWFGVSPRYLESSGARLLAGRWFTERDRSAPSSVVISARFARRFAADFPDHASLIGRTTAGPFTPAGSNEQETPMTIIGVVSDFRSGRFGIMRPDDANALPQVFFPDSLRPQTGGELLVRTSSDPMALVGPVQTIVRGRESARLVGARTLSDQLNAAVAPRIFATVLMVAFAGIALLLAMVGLFGVLSYAVTQQTSEIGLRVALGARRSDILRLVLSQASTLVVAGAAIGLAGCVALSRLISGVLYGVTPTDVWAYVTVSLLLLAVALAAAYLPARRAMRVAPMVALRHG